MQSAGLSKLYASVFVFWGRLRIRRRLITVYYPEDSIFVTGVAKVSKDDAINALYGALSLSMVIDLHTNRIIDVNANVVMKETNQFLKAILVGKNIVTDVDAMCDTLRRRFLALSQKAVIVALRDAQNRYLMAFPDLRDTSDEA